jgi:hypothetical protein
MLGVKVMCVKLRSVVKTSAPFEETRNLGISHWPCKYVTFRFTISCHRPNRKYEEMLLKLLHNLTLL